MKYDVVGFGALNVDNIYLVDEIAGVDEETSIRSQKRYIGGSAANTIIGLSRLGVKCAYIGKIAKDEEGKFIKNRLLDEGVDTRCLITSSDGRSGKVFVFVDRSGNRAIYVDPGVNDTITIDEIEKICFSTKILHLTSFVGKISFKTQKSILNKIDSRTTVSFDPGMLYVRMGEKALREFLEKTNILLINEKEIRILCDEEDYKRAANSLLDYVDIIVVKRGKNSVYLRTKNLELFVPTLKVKCVDTTGAGDAFNAGFLYGYLNNYSLRKSCILGNYVASCCIKKFGATDGIPRNLNGFKKYEERVKNETFYK